MRKILSFFLITFFLLIHYSATAQTKLKAEKAFLAELNNILSNTKEQHWAYKGVMTIDSAFAISKSGDLAVTVRYKDEDGIVIARMSAPVKETKWVAYDLYIILEYNSDVVTSFESKKNSKKLKGLQKSNYFHIGVPLYDGEQKKEELQKLLVNLLKYYRK